MTIIEEMSFDQFRPWSGAVETWNRIFNAGKLDELERALDEIYCDRDHITDTELNDLLWFDADSVYDWLGMKTDDEIAEERKAREERRTTIRKLLDAATGDDFCELWADLDKECIECPLNSLVDDCATCDSLQDYRTSLQAIVDALLKEVDEEEDE